MATSQAEIKAWFLKGKQTVENTHMIIVCDTFDYDDYPVYVTNTEDVKIIEERYRSMSMQRVMEVYSLDDPLETQLNKPRAFNRD